MSSPHTQRFFPTYHSEHTYTTKLISLTREATKPHPNLFHKLTTLLATAPDGLLSVLPTLIHLLRNAGLAELADAYITYARFVSDVTDDGLPRREKAQVDLDADTVVQPEAETEAEAEVEVEVKVNAKKRKRPASGVLPQRRSVRQWNRIPAGAGWWGEDEGSASLS